MKTQSQYHKILSHLKRGWKLTPIQALNKYGCLRLAARIEEIRDAGFKVATNMVTRNGARFAEYQLER